MARWRADRTWLVYRGTESFAMAIGWTLAPVYFVLVGNAVGIRTALAAGAAALTPALLLYGLALRRGDDGTSFDVLPQVEG